MPMVERLATRWEVPFDDALLFPHLPIRGARYSIEVQGSAFAQHAMRPAQNLTAVVATSEAVTGTVTVTVTQGEFSVGNSW